MLTIGTIWARGGSVGALRKNIQLLLSTPLSVDTIDQALSVIGIDRIFVSTDPKDIADVALVAGAEVTFLRPAHLAIKNTPKLVTARASSRLSWEKIGSVDIVVDLEPTLPLGSLEDIQTFMGMLENNTDIVIALWKRLFEFG